MSVRRFASPHRRPSMQGFSIIDTDTVAFVGANGPISGGTSYTDLCAPSPIALLSGQFLCLWDKFLPLACVCVSVFLSVSLSVCV